MALMYSFSFPYVCCITAVALANPSILVTAQWLPAGGRHSRKKENAIRGREAAQHQPCGRSGQSQPRLVILSYLLTTIIVPGKRFLALLIITGGKWAGTWYWGVWWQGQRMQSKCAAWMLAEVKPPLSCLGCKSADRVVSFFSNSPYAFTLLHLLWQCWTVTFSIQNFGSVVHWLSKGPISRWKCLQCTEKITSMRRTHPGHRASVRVI